jgi:hypothetical protein
MTDRRISVNRATFSGCNSVQLCYCEVHSQMLVPELNNRQLLNIQQVVTRMKVSRRTVYYWIAKGKVEWVKAAGGRTFIFADSLFHEPSVTVTPKEPHADAT